MKNVKTAKRIVSATGWILAFLVWIIWYAMVPDEPEWIGWVIAISVILIGEGLVNRILLPETKQKISRLSSLPDVLEKDEVIRAFKESVTNPHRIVESADIIHNFIEALKKKRSLNIQNEDILFLYTGIAKPKLNKPPRYSGLMSCAGAVLVTNRRLIAIDVGLFGPKKELASIQFNRISRVESGGMGLKILIDNGRKYEISVLDEDKRAVAESILNICESKR
ncbi:hypothetical protein JW835_07595 [bacterium]|nr:hypothetical protein [bacterium]